MPWTAGKDFLQWSNTQERQISREGKGRGREGALVQELGFPSSLALEKEQNKKSDRKWIPPSLHILALYRVPFLLARASEGHASCLSILYRTSALHVLILVCRIRQGRHDLAS